MNEEEGEEETEEDEMEEDEDMEYGDEVEEEEEDEDDSAGQVNGTKSAINGFSKGFGAGVRGWWSHALGNQMEGKEN